MEVEGGAAIATVLCAIVLGDLKNRLIIDHHIRILSTATRNWYKDIIWKLRQGSGKYWQGMVKGER